MASDHSCDAPYCSPVAARKRGSPRATHTTATHLISTSVFRGKVFTATHLNYVSYSSVQVMSHSRSRRFDFAPILDINLVHSREIIHRSQEDVDFHDLVQTGASGIQNSAQIGNALALQSVSTASASQMQYLPYGPGYHLRLICPWKGWSESIPIKHGFQDTHPITYLAGAIDEPIGNNRLFVDARQWLRRVIGGDCLL